MSMAIKYAMKKKMAKGGDVKGVHSPWSETSKSQGKSWAGMNVEGANMAKEAGQKKAEPARKQMAKNEHHRVLAEMHEMRGQDRTNLADGGEVTSTATIDPKKAADATASMRKAFGYAHGGMVDRIMAKRGGEEPTADFESNDFDEMDSHPAPHDADYTGANSGDDLGNEEMDENDQDLISRIMRSRAKKDRMPRPA